MTKDAKSRDALIRAICWHVSNNVYNGDQTDPEHLLETVSSFDNELLEKLETATEIDYHSDRAAELADYSTALAMLARGYGGKAIQFYLYLMKNWNDLIGEVNYGNATQEYPLFESLDHYTEFPDGTDSYDGPTGESTKVLIAVLGTVAEIQRKHSSIEGPYAIYYNDPVIRKLLGYLDVDDTSLPVLDRNVLSLVMERPEDWRAIADIVATRYTNDPVYIRSVLDNWALSSGTL